MKITPEDLFPDEKLILSKNSNAIIAISDFGLSRFAFDKYMWVVGMKNKEGIGGKIHLTNYRLIFKSHAMNRLKGTFSILLPAVTAIHNSSFLMTRKMSIDTRFNRFDFVVWGVSDLIEQIEQAQAQFSEDDFHQLRSNIVHSYGKFGNGLEIVGGVEQLNKLLLLGDGGLELLELAGDPFQAIGLMMLEELFDQSLADEWQKYFDAPDFDNEPDDET